MSAPKPARASDRALLSALTVVALMFSAWYSWAAPCGIFGNHVFGTRVWSEADPGAWYLYAAYQLGQEEPPIYYGHPGTPLLLLLRGIQHGYAAVAAPSGTGHGRFIAQHLPQVFWLSKMASTALHLLSFWALYRLSVAVLRDRRAALLATLGYATCFPVLYYLSRISPEPIAVACLAAAFLAYFRYEELTASGERLRALGSLTLAAAVATTGAVAKLQLLAPLPLLLAAMTLTDLPQRLVPRNARRPPRSGAARLAALAVFTCTMAATLAFYSIFIEWRRFFGYWSLLPSVRSGPKAVDLADLYPGLSAGNLLPTAEASFAAIAAIGFVLALRSSSELRPRMVALGAYAMFGAALLAYRVAIHGSFLPFHYAFAALAGAAPFFGFALARWERRLFAHPTALQSVAFALGSVALVHGLGIAAVLGSRQQDARTFAPNRAAYTVIAKLEPEEVLWVENRAKPYVPLTKQELPDRLQRLAGWSAGGILGVGGKPPLLRLEFESLFAPAPKRAPRALGLERVPVPWLRANLVRPR